MPSDLDIYRSANLLVKRHGEDAPIHAAMRADAMLEKGDLDGYAVWKRILRATKDPLRAATNPVSGRSACSMCGQRRIVAGKSPT